MVYAQTRIDPGGALGSLGFLDTNGSAKRSDLVIAYKNLPTSGL